jgi:hypothetical protein
LCFHVSLDQAESRSMRCVGVGLPGRKCSK